MDYGFLKQAYAGKKGEAQKKDVVDLVRRWVKRNPIDAQMNLEQNRDIRHNIKDKEYGILGGPKKKGAVGEKTDIRLTLAVHPDLLNYVETFYPDFFEHKENTRWFARRFKGFAIPEKQ